MNLKENWNEKSKNYPRFSGKLNLLQQSFLNFAKSCGVVFDDMDIIDIGCGTGVFSLYFAEICKNLTCNDVSDEMLKICQDSIDLYGFKNVFLCNARFDELAIDKKFDIALCTLSPALNCEKDYLKFDKLATRKLYLNWSKYRYSSMLEPFFAFYGENSWSNNTERLCRWLIDNSIEYKSQDFYEEKVVLRDYESAYNDVIWHLNINKINYKNCEIEEILSRQLVDDVIRDTLKINTRFIVW